MNFEKQKERYYNDPIFHTIVETMRLWLHTGKINIYELKDAANFAINMFAMQDMPSYHTVFISEDEFTNINLSEKVIERLRNINKIRKEEKE
jgi:hypothetical protein